MSIQAQRSWCKRKGNQYSDILFGDYWSSQTHQPTPISIRKPRRRPNYHQSGVITDFHTIELLYNRWRRRRRRQYGPRGHQTTWVHFKQIVLPPRGSSSSHMLTINKKNTPRRNNNQNTLPSSSYF